MPLYGGKCLECIHWQSYPFREHMGVCENPESRYYDRSVFASNEACDRFTEMATLRKCEQCDDWYPLDIQPRLGECNNPASPRYRKAVFWDQTAGDCFEEGSLEKMGLMWCETCRQTIHTDEFDRHAPHRLFAGSAQFPVEDMMEVTLAGD